MMNSPMARTIEIIIARIVKMLREILAIFIPLGSLGFLKDDEFIVLYAITVL